MIIAVHAVTSRRNTRPRAVTFLGTGEQEYDRIDKGDRQSFPCALLRCLERRQFSVQCRDGKVAYPPPPVPAVPPSQTNDGKGFLRFKPSQRRPKSSSSRPKGCSGVLLGVLSVSGEGRLLEQEVGRINGEG